MSANDKTHYRKAFNSPYLSSADVVGATVLTIARVTLEKDKTKKTKDEFNTAYFTEREIRPGEPLKPMILNASNSKVMRELTGSPWIEDWRDVRVTVYVDHNVKFGKETVEGLRISPQPPAADDGVRQKAMERLTEAAKQGKEAFAAAWKDTTKAVRQMLSEADVASLKKVCEEAAKPQAEGESEPA